jgi:hypothetical protein
MSLDDIARVRQNFVDAAIRARDAGFEWLELHFAHGYLAQSFFSAHSNQRDDIYGGSVENRARFLLETLRAVREVWPEHLALTVRFGVLEYDGRDEQTLVESIALVRQFKESGMDMISVTIGFTIPEVQIPWGPAFLGPIAQRVRARSGSAGLVGLGLRHAGTGRACRQGGPAGPGDGRPLAPGQSALDLPGRQGTGRGAPLVDAAGTLCALAGTLLMGWMRRRAATLLGRDSIPASRSGLGLFVF